jgi:hypothetical protein
MRSSCCATDRDLSPRSPARHHPLGSAPRDTIKGFRIGADTDVNVSGEAITWQAFRNAEPKRS